MVEHLRALFSGGKSGESRNKCSDRKEEAREEGRTTDHLESCTGKVVFVVGVFTVL